MKNDMTYQDEIYPYKVIERAIIDYQSICDIEVKRMAGGCRCSFSNSKGTTDINRIILEFTNYLVELVETQDI